MHRRTMLLSVGTGLVVSSAVPRASRAQNTGSTLLQGGTDGIRGMIAVNGAASAQSSMLAHQRTGNPLVKQFAELEAEEQENMLRATRTQDSDTPRSPQPPTDKKQMLQQLQATEGPAFDRLYVKGQLSAHQELLGLHRSLLNEADDEGQDTIIPLLGVPAIKSHIAMLEMIEKQLV